MSQNLILSQNKILSYIISFFIMFLVATLPTDSMKSINTPWYQCVRTKITPPNYIFPIAWTILYTFIAICLAETMQLPASNSKNLLLFIYAINLILNVSWSIVYFGMKHVYLAYFILFALMSSTLTIIYLSYDKMPTWIIYLLIPYYLWLSFALILSTVSLDKKC